MNDNPPSDYLEDFPPEIICILCDAMVDPISNAPVCENCFEEYALSYFGRRQLAIEAWEKENPRPVFYCKNCNKPHDIYEDGYFYIKKYCDACLDQIEKKNAKELRTHPAKRMGYVYFAFNGKYIKIGHTHNLEKRMEVLGIEPIHILQIADCAKCEHFLHEYLAGSRVVGEWFDLGWDLIEWIKSFRSDGLTVTDCYNGVVWSAEDGWVFWDGSDEE